MNRNRIFGSAVFVVFIAAAFLIFGSQAAFAKEKVIKMTLAHADVADATQNVHAAAVAFKNYVEKESQGKIQVSVSPGAALGNTASLQEMTMSGEIEAATSQTEGTIAIVYPNIQAMTVPYLFQSVDQALDVFRGAYGQELFEDMRRQTGLRVIGLWDNGGFRNFTNNKRPVHSPADMAGLSIRTMDIPAHMELVRSLGAKPTPISWAEVYTSLQTGVVDGQENSIPIVILGSLQEVQKYMILDHHVYTQQHLMVNDAWFQTLSPAHQQIILRGGEKAGLAGERAARVYREIGKSIIGEKMEIYTPTQDELAQFKASAQAPVLKFIREKGVSDPKWVDGILTAADESLVGLGYVKK
jgi:tripartite ATP-independent transporter DctP family solute receptor